MRGTLVSFVVLATSAYAASVAELVAELRGAPTQSDRISALDDSQVYMICSSVVFLSIDLTLIIYSTSSTSCLLPPALPPALAVSL